MATIRFFLQSQNAPANIYLYLSAGSGRFFKRKTGYIINPDQWSNATNLPKQNDEEMKILKSRLSKLSDAIEKSLNELVAGGGEPSGEWLEDQIDIANGKKKSTDDERLINYIQRYIDYLPYKEFPNGKFGATRPTLTKYNTLKKKIVEFEEYQKKKYYLRDVNPSFRNELVKYFREVDRLGGNTTGRYVKFLKTVCLDAQGNGFDVSPQLRNVKGFTEKAAKIFLSFEELEKIENEHFTRDALDNAKDWLIIGCYIGQRVGDLLTLTSDSIVTRAGLEVIELVQEKTGKSVQIPIHDKVREILDKRNGNFPRPICDQKFNLHIKDICRQAGINQPVQGGKLATIGKNTTRKQFGTFPKWELVTSHICRRSFASNFYGDMPKALIMSITAHGTEQQFLQYIGKNTNDYAVQIAECFRKMALEKEQKSQLRVVKKAN